MAIPAQGGHYWDVRLFAGIPLPQNVRDHVARALDMVHPAQRAARNPWIPSVNWHITLAFYGEQPEGMVDQLVENIQAAARETAPFELGLAGAGVFHQEVCWIGLSDSAEVLGPLAQKVRGSYTSGDQHTKNRFHLTVSRAGRHGGLADAMSALSVYRGPVWTADHICLFHSTLGQGVGGHPLYKVLARVPLG